MILSCPDGYRIRVKKAFWRAHDNQECGSQRPSAEQQCQNKYVVDKWTQLCLGKRECEIHLSTSTFGEVCHGIPKQMELSYTCGQYEALIF